MKASKRRSLTRFLLVLALGVVIGNTIVASRALSVLVEAQGWVDHTWQVIYQGELILGSVRDAETSTRGFALSGDEQFLLPYTAAMRDLPGQLDTFGRLTADNPREQQRLVELRATLDQRLAILKNGIDLRRRGQVDTIHANVTSGVGRRLMDRVRTIVNGIEAEERSLLTRRDADVHTARQRTRFAVFLASLLDLLLILLGLQYLRREQGMRLEAESQAAQLDVARTEALVRTAELNILNASLEERVRQRTVELETTNRELEAFSYSVSHDLRAPLRTIDGFSLALEEDYASAVDAVGRDYISRVRSGVQRMGQLIDALLQLSRITRAEITKQVVDMTRLAESVAANLRDENPGRTIKFEIEGGLLGTADPALVQVALENLIGNAVKFTSKVDDAKITFGWDADQLAWRVQDNGAGFDMYYADKLFSAFNRLHGDKDFKGSGIGLATVARVVRRHHGRIWADSTVGHGATFWFTLG